MAAARVFLVDDHEIVRRGVKEFVAEHDDLEIAGEAASVTEALLTIPGSRADIAVIDVRLPDGNGVELCRELRSRHSDLRCLMLSSFADDEALLNAVMAGAAGYVLKHVLGAELIIAIRKVVAGETLIDHNSTSALMDTLRVREAAEPLRRLTPQQRAVLELIGEGLTNRQIAERLFLTEKTVKNYVSQVLAKLGMQRRTQAAAFSVRWQLGRHPGA